MKKATINKILSLVATMEKQGRGNVTVKAELKADYNGTWDKYNSYDVIIFNSYTVLRIDARYYRAIENRRKTLPPMASLEGLTRKKIIDGLFVREHGETTDTNISVNDVTSNDLPTHYIINSDYVIAVNNDIHNALMKMYDAIGDKPQLYSTTDINAVVYSLVGIEAAVLPIRINQNDKLPTAIKSIFTFDDAAAVV